MKPTTVPLTLEAFVIFTLVGAYPDLCLYAQPPYRTTVRQSSGDQRIAVRNRLETFLDNSTHRLCALETYGVEEGAPHFSLS